MKRVVTIIPLLAVILLASCDRVDIDINKNNLYGEWYEVRRIGTEWSLKLYGVEEHAVDQVYDSCVTSYYFGKDHIFEVYNIRAFRDAPKNSVEYKIERQWYLNGETIVVPEIIEARVLRLRKNRMLWHVKLFDGSHWCGEFDIELVRK